MSEFNEIVTNCPKNSSNMTKTLNDLLDELGFAEFTFAVYQFVIPSIGIVGGLLSIMSMRIFSEKEFKYQMYDYYRLLAKVYFIHLSMSVPYGLFFTPKYFLRIDTNAWATYQCLYLTISNLLSHFAECLVLGLIVDRLRNYVSFVKKFFTFSPKSTSWILFIACCVINVFEAFANTTYIGGKYYFVNEEGCLQEDTFYYVVSSKFDSSSSGLIVRILVYIARDVFTLIASIVFITISLIHLRKYLYKQHLLSILHVRRNNLFRQNAINRITPGKRIIFIETISLSFPREITTVINSNKLVVGQKLLLVAIMINGVSLITHVVWFVCNLGSHYARTTSLKYYMACVGALANVLGPSVSFFVFFIFSANFHRIFLKILAF